MTRALVTGGQGFVGQHLLHLLIERGVEWRSFDLRSGHDIRNYEHVRSAVEEFEPDWIFHLAAQADVPEGLLDPRRALEVNTLGTLNVLEAMRNTASRARILITGSAAEYGNAGSAGQPVDELSPAFPTEPYAVSKLAATSLGTVYHQKYGLPVIVTRAFNHTGPGRPSRYVDAAFARRIVSIERGHLDVLTHGDLSAIRNFTDVRDVVRAYLAVIAQTPGIYNICSENNISIGQVLNLLKRTATVEITTKLDPSFGRSNVGEVFHSPTAMKLNTATGWIPEISLEQTFADLLDWWRTQ